jgi:hypothetical protein
MNVVNLKNEAIEIAPQPAKVVFSNDGEIDMRAITTLGISAKDNAGAIGYFGTGLKYAIAILLREGQSVTVWSGVKKYSFKKKEINFRNKGFEVVTMNGKELPITTEYGKNWKVWQAYRELHCNCTDEFGQVTIQSGEIKGVAGKTIIVCEGDDIREAYESRSTIILEGIPLLKNDKVEVYAGQTHNIYYRNIKALETKHCLYTYNIKTATTLTEDRTIAYAWAVRGYIMNMVLGSSDKNFIKTILTAPEGSFEYTMDFTDQSEATASPSREFLEVAADLVAKTEGSYTLKAFVDRHHKQSSGEIRAIKNLTAHQQKLLDAAIELAELMEYPVKKYSIVVTAALGYNILGLADDGRIYLSDQLFSLGVKTIAATLIEEYIHLEHGLKDNSREMQNYLFGKVVELGAELHNKVI